MKGNFNVSIKDYNEAIRIDPKYAQAYYNRGLAKKALGDVSGAMGDFGQLHALDPEFIIP